MPGLVGRPGKPCDRARPRAGGLQQPRADLFTDQQLEFEVRAGAQAIEREFKRAADGLLHHQALWYQGQRGQRRFDLQHAAMLAQQGREVQARAQRGECGIEQRRHAVASVAQGSVMVMWAGSGASFTICA